MGLRLYRVKHGDTPALIAKKYTGNEQRHRELLEANPAFQQAKPGSNRDKGKLVIGWKMLKTDDMLILPEAWPMVGNDTPTIPEVPNPPTVPPPPPPAPVVITNVPKRLPPTLTPASTGDIVRALRKAWPLELKYDPPKPECIAVLTAQWALETGWGRSCVAWNLGNVKSRQGDGSDFTYFKCWEVLDSKTAHALVAQAPPRTGDGAPSVLIDKELPDGKARVTIFPDHEGCRFRAFASLEEGARAYLQKLHTRFGKAWNYVDAGDPSGFAAALKSLGYFTAPLDGPEGYRPALVRIFNQVVKQAATEDVHA